MKHTSIRGPLTDSFGRVHRNLRVSVTDRCNIRCFYCMPDENVSFRPRHEILTFEEIARFVSIVAQLGIQKIRITGGEPLVRADLHRLIAMISTTEGIHDVALTTNGILLAEQARSLRDAGLKRINISLDTLRPDVFRKLTRRNGLDRVLAGIHTARHVGFEKIRLNAIAIQGTTEEEIIPLVQFARETNLELRFIEFMPLDADGNWSTDQVLSGEFIRSRIEQDFGTLIPSDRPDNSQPAFDYQFEDGKGAIGFINPVTEPFCGTCDRLRITSEGCVRNCLFSIKDWDVRALLRGPSRDAEIAQVVVDCVSSKKQAHGINSDDFSRPERAMYQIGG